MVSLLFLFVLAACGVPGSPQPVLTETAGAHPTTPAPTATLTAAPTVVATATAILTPTRTATLTKRPTSTATATTAPLVRLAEDLSVIVANEAWPSLGIDPDRAIAWEAFAQGDDSLSVDELRSIENFVNQWHAIEQAAAGAILPEEAEIDLRTAVYPDAVNGAGPVLYAAVGAGHAVGGAEQLFLIARDHSNRPMGLVAAPPMEGMFQRIDPTGQYVEYIDERRKTPLLLADARHLSGRARDVDILKERLEEIYLTSHPYTRVSIYPRFYFPIEGIGSGFFTLEESITYQQVLQLNEAFQLYDRPDLAPLKAHFFSPNTSVIIVEQMEIAAGLTHIGSGVMELDRKDLFGNKYFLAEVLAHEAAHVLQGRIADRSAQAACQSILRREVGDHTVADDFLEWSAEDLVQHVKAIRIGSYHVSMWMMNKLGIRGAQLNILREVIATGAFGGQSVVPFCK